MAKLYQEEQRYHEPLSRLLLLVLTGVALFNIGGHLIQQGWDRPLIYALAGLLSLGLIALAVRALRLRIKISRNKFRIQVQPLPWSRRKIHREEVERIYFFSLSEATLTGGWAVGVHPATQCYNFGDRSGIVLLLKNGEEIRVFSRELYEQADQLIQEMQHLGWPVDQSLSAE
jgi:hypothetical protein